jgi:hypothetical protein
MPKLAPINLVWPSNHMMWKFIDFFLYCPYIKKHSKFKHKKKMAHSFVIMLLFHLYKTCVKGQPQILYEQGN